jgi:hypothetical protein
MREMRSALASRIYKNGVKQSASGAVSPDPQWSIPMFRANFLCFASKIVEPSRYLPAFMQHISPKNSVVVSQ